jgi:hypothetical protein
MADVEKVWVIEAAQRKRRYHRQLLGHVGRIS